MNRPRLEKKAKTRRESMQIQSLPTFPSIHNRNVESPTKSASYRVSYATARYQHLRKRKREDSLLGVPENFKYPEVKCDIIDEDEILRQFIFNRRKKYFMDPSKLVNLNNKIDLPKLNKVPNFIGRSKTIVCLDRKNGSTVGWSLPRLPVSDSIFSIPLRRSVVEGSHRSRCRQPYPVTVALHREGTSVTHQAGIACRHFNVSKVWPRDLSTKFATPHEMAIHDRKYFYNG